MKKYIFGSLMAIVASCTVAMAEVSVSGGVDLVSSYNWRGMQQSGPAFQPGMEVAVGGLSVSAWGSSAFDSDPDVTTTTKELDLTVSYTLGSFSIAYTNYWWDGETALYFNEGTHQSEIALGYECESLPLSVSWSTMIAGDIDKKGEYAYTKDLDDQCFSTYINVAYAFEVEGVDCTASLGLTPWTGQYSGTTTGFNVASIGLNASKAIVETDKFTLPLFVDLSFSPTQEMAYLVAGLSFGF